MAAPRLPLSSLRLLVPPLRLLTAAMWHVARHQNVKHYQMLEDFVSLVTEAVPQLLTNRQRSLLLLALRAKVTLSVPSDVHAHLSRIRSVSEATLDDDVSDCCSALSMLANKLSETPAETQDLLQEVFNQKFESALQSLISDFLSRIEQLFPVPDFKQAASWFDGSPTALDNCLQDTDRKDLREILTNQTCRQAQAIASVGCDAEIALLFSCSHPLLTKRRHTPTPSTDVRLGPISDDDSLQSVELEVEVITEDRQVEETVIVHTVSTNQSSAQDAGENSGTFVVPEDRRKETPGNPDSQSDPSDSIALRNVFYNPKRVAHKCPQCGKCFIYRSEVFRHLRTSRTCGSSSARRAAQPRPSGALACFQCDAAFADPGELLAHQRSHRARPLYQCAECGRAFPHLASLTNHKQARRENGCAAEAGNETGVRKELPCNICGQAFASHARLLKHLETHSLDGGQMCFQCPYCDQSFSGLTQVRIHLRSHVHQPYQCNRCDKSFSSERAMHVHRANHEKDSRFLCSQCGKRFKKREGLEGHLRLHSGERPYRCPHCPKDFTAAAGLNVHVRQHTGERPYVCAVCGKSWTSGGDLQKHMRIHTGERPYVCQDCGKAFSISCHLKEHRRIHSGEKPFICTVCGKSIRRKFDLKKHMLSHSDVRPFTCCFCSKGYTRRTHLTRHLLTHKLPDGEAAEEA